MGLKEVMVFSYRMSNSSLCRVSAAQRLCSEKYKQLDKIKRKKKVRFFHFEKEEVSKKVKKKKEEFNKEKAQHLG